MNGNDDAWGFLERRLVRGIDALVPREFLIIDAPDGVYVQVARDPEALWCEAVSRNYLDRPDWDAVEEVLADDEWFLDPDPEANHVRVLPLHEANRAASAFVHALRDAYGVSSPLHVEVHRGTFPDGPDGGVRLTVVA